MKSKKTLRRLFSAAALLGLAVGMMIMPVTTTRVNAENVAVTDAKNAVMQVKVVYVDDTGVSHDVQSGTAFLINDTTALTAEHVVSVDDATMQAIADQWGNGKTAEQCRSKLQIVINVLRDNTMTATVKTSSSELDFAVLSLQQAINSREALPIRSSAGVIQTENCYALGFPAEFQPLQSVQTFTSDDVTIQNGQVSKISDITTDNGTASYVVSSAKITSGFSGGPLVDDNGAVIGILKGYTSSNYFDQDYYYSVATDEIMSVLDYWGIEYKRVPGPDPTPSVTPVPEPSTTPETVDKTALASAITAANEVATDDYTDESVEEFEAALSIANSVNDKADATESEVNDALNQLKVAQDGLEKKGFGLSIPLIIGIVGGVIVIVIIIIIVAAKSKKKEVPDYGTLPQSETPLPPVNNSYTENKAAPQNSSIPQYNGSADTTVLGGSAGETTVLGGRAAETTVLNAKSYGTLVRKKNGEKVTISKDHFRIGRERNNVDYCISDDTNVGRLHAEIISSGTKTYVVDKNSRNSTFVNDVRCTPGQQVELKEGDRVMFADDEYTYHQF